MPNEEKSQKSKIANDQYTLNEGREIQEKLKLYRYENSILSEQIKILKSEFDV